MPMQPKLSSGSSWKCGDVAWIVFLNVISGSLCLLGLRWWRRPDGTTDDLTMAVLWGVSFILLVCATRAAKGDARAFREATREARVLGLPIGMMILLGLTNKAYWLWPAVLEQIRSQKWDHAIDLITNVGALGYLGGVVVGLCDLLRGNRRRTDEDGLSVCESSAAVVEPSQDDVASKDDVASSDMVMFGAVAGAIAGAVVAAVAIARRTGN